MKIFLTGGTGQIGWELRRTLAPLGEVAAPTREDVDLTDLPSLGAAVRSTKPEIIVNAAAYTDVDGAEGERERAEVLNARVPGVLAEEANRADALLVHFSTDYVFSGEKTEPYVEGDDPAPANAYGDTKLAGEEAVRASDARALILRTSWIYGLRRTNFLLTMSRLFRNRERVRVVDDQRGVPTWSRMVAEATCCVLAGDDVPTGIYHLTGDGDTTWHGFAQAILEEMRRAGRDGGLQVREVVPIASGELDRPARRPAYSVLSSEKAARDLGIRLPHWRSQLRLCLEELR